MKQTNPPQMRHESAPWQVRNEINNTFQALDVIARYDFDFSALWRRSGDFSTNNSFSIVCQPLVPCCAVATALTRWAAAYQGPLTLIWAWGREAEIVGR